MPKLAGRAQPQPGPKDRGKKRYEPPDLRKREKLAEVTGSAPVVVPPIPVT